MTTRRQGAKWSDDLGQYVSDYPPGPQPRRRQSTLLTIRQDAGPGLSVLLREAFGMTRRDRSTGLAIPAHLRRYIKPVTP